MALGPATILSPSDVPPPTLVGMGSLNEALMRPYARGGLVEVASGEAYTV